MRLVLDKEYAPALMGLDGFSHIQVLWWFSECDNAVGREMHKEISNVLNDTDY